VADAEADRKIRALLNIASGDLGKVDYGKLSRIDLSGMQDGARVESEAAQTKLQHGNVPADRADAELPLAEQGASASTERSSRRTAYETGRPNAVLALKREQCAGGQPAANAVDGPSVEPVSPEPDLECGDASTGGEP